jgi:hypothetical protein
MIQKNKILETSLVLTTAFLVVYVLSSKVIFLYLALAMGIIGIFIPPLAKWIAIAWFKLADLLNYVVSKVVLGTLFLFLLFPIAAVYRILGKNKMQLNRMNKSNWVERNQTYIASDIENIW